jgi:hypothetical protein
VDTALAKKVVPAPLTRLLPLAVNTVAVEIVEAQDKAPLTMAHFPLLDERVNPEPAYYL